MNASKVSVTATDLGADVSTVTAALFTCPLGDDAALIPRTAAIAEAFQALLEANYERLAHWFPEHSTRRRRWNGLVRTWSEEAGHGSKGRSCRWPSR